MEVIAHWLWQGCAIAVVTAVLLRFLDRASSQLRYRVCWAGAAVVFLPLLASIVPAPLTPLPALTVTSPLSMPIESASESMPAIEVFLALWGVWFLVHVRHLAVAMLTNRHRRTRYSTFPRSLEQSLFHWSQVKEHGRRSRLVVSDDVRAAAVVGCGSPVIAVAPTLIQRLTADELDRVVIHEWAHVQRRDDFAHLLQLMLRALAGWHPAIWWLDRRLQVERENACDEITVSLTGSAKAYAACLVKLADVTVARRELVPSLGALSSASVVHRVRRIVSNRCVLSHVWSRNAAAVAIVFLVGMSLAVSSLRFVEAVAASQNDAPLAVATPAPQQAMTDLLAPIVNGPVSRTRSRVPARAWAAPPVPTETTAQDATPTTRSVTPTRTEPDSEPPRDPVEPATAEQATTPEAPLPSRSIQMPPPQRVTPWGAAADAGIAIGQGSKKGGQATAAFFTRLGKRVADSF
jgi:beta-lactamase regulating signal transducer with metallopeptidase domain